MGAAVMHRGQTVARARIPALLMSPVLWFLHGHAIGADYAISREDCANLKTLVDDAVFDFENRQGARTKSPASAPELHRYEITGSTAPFEGCGLVAESTSRSDRMLTCRLIDTPYRADTFRADATYRQGLLTIVGQFVDSIGSCVGVKARTAAFPSDECGDACTTHVFEWKVNVAPPKLNVLLKIRVNIPNDGAIVGGLRNEFGMHATLWRTRP